MNSNEDLTLTPGDEDLVAADIARAARGPRTMRPGQWGFECPRDPFLGPGNGDRPF